MSAVAESLRALLSRALPRDDGDSALISGNASERRELAARQAVADAREQLKTALAHLEQLKVELAVAIEREDYATGQLDTGRVLERARQARAADIAARRAAIERGESSTDRALADEAEASMRELRDTRASARAAKDALPGLERRTRDVRDSLTEAEYASASARGRIIVAVVALRTLRAHALAAELNEYVAELAGASDFFLHRGDWGSPPGSVPPSLVPEVRITLSNDELRRHARPWKQFDSALKADPDAEFVEPASESIDERFT